MASTCCASPAPNWAASIILPWTPEPVPVLAMHVSWQQLPTIIDTFRNFIECFAEQRTLPMITKAQIVVLMLHQYESLASVER